jgi:hypothetical protein
VANKPPQPSRHRFLYDTGGGPRRLFQEADQSHPKRQGKITPKAEDIPPRYRYLLDWYNSEYAGSRQDSWLSGIYEMIGAGKEIFAGADPMNMFENCGRVGLSRIFWDTNIFIYLLEGAGEPSQLARGLLDRMVERRDELLTSTLTPGEVLVRPIEARQPDTANKMGISSPQRAFNWFRSTGTLPGFMLASARIVRFARRMQSSYPAQPR